MRVILYLEGLSHHPYSSQYHRWVQGFIYRMLRGTDYDSLHDKHGFKYFNFSNLFPIGDVYKGEVKKLVISSPDGDFINILYRRLRTLCKADETIKIGPMYFKLKDVKRFRVKLDYTPLQIYTATPVVIRIPRRYYSLYGIEGDNEYQYWRKKHGLTVFINMTRLNLLKKYRDFHGVEPPTTSIYQSLRLRRSDIHRHIKIHGEAIIVGSLWTLTYHEIDKDLKRILEFMVDTGLGELNSMGFGFLNPKTVI